MSRAFRFASIVCGTLLALAGTGSPAQAQVEIGASLLQLSAGSAPLAEFDNKYVTLTAPGAAFLDFRPAVYATFRIKPRLAVGPAVSLFWSSGAGSSTHFLHLAVEADYFLEGSDRSSAYVLGSAGIFEVSEGRTTPASVAGGGGYRWRLGDRLTARVDGRVTHVTDGGGNSFTAAFSIGGLFGGN